MSSFFEGLPETAVCVLVGAQRLDHRRGRPVVEMEGEKPPVDLPTMFLHEGPGTLRPLFRDLSHVLVLGDGATGYMGSCLRLTPQTGRTHRGAERC